MIKGETTFGEAIEALHRELDDVIPSPFSYISLAIADNGLLIEMKRPKITFYTRGNEAAKTQFKYDSYLLEGVNDSAFPSFRLLSRLYSKANNPMGEKGLAASLPFHNKSGKWNVLSSLLSDHNRTSLQLRDFRGGVPKVKELGQKCLVEAGSEALKEVDLLGLELGKAEKEALREVLYNALVHNAYELGDPYMEIRESSIHVVSRSHDPVDLSFPRPKNPSLFCVYKDLGLVYGAGIGGSLIRNGSDYIETSFHNGEFSVVIRINKQPSRFIGHLGEIKNEPVGEIKPKIEDPIKEKVYALICQNVSIKRNAIAKAAKLSPRSLDRIIKALKDEGLIIGRTSNKNGKWVLPESETKL